MKDMGRITNRKAPAAKDLAADIARQNPTMRIAYDALHNAAIGVWDVGIGRFLTVFSLTIDNRWVKIPFEMLVNGQPLEREWVEVSAN